MEQTISQNKIVRIEEAFTGEKTVVLRVDCGIEATLIHVPQPGSTTDLSITLGDSARVTLYCLSFAGSHASRVRILLEGRGAKVQIYGLFLGRENDEFTLDHTIEHIGKETVSDILIKGVLSNSARASYDGLIKMRPGVDGAEGAEQADTLLLSKDAYVRAVPHLQIAHNNVKCSHAVTTTYLNKEKLFYMNSRGIAEQTALQLHITAHVNPVIESLPDKTLQTSILNFIQEQYART